MYFSSMATGSVREACCAAQVRAARSSTSGSKLVRTLTNAVVDGAVKRPQTGAVERPQGTKLMLGQRLGELADCGRTVVSGKLRGDRDGQDGGERIAPPARAAEIGHTMKTLPQASQSMGGPRSRVAFASPLWGIVEAAQLLARVAGQRVDQDLLRSAVGDPGRGRAGACGQSRGCGPAPASSPPGSTRR